MAEHRRNALAVGQEVSRPSNVRAHLEKVLGELPERVQAYLEDLETRLAKRQVERGKDILASLGTEVKISPDGIAEIRGDLRKVLSFMGDRKNKSVNPWLGEEALTRPHIVSICVHATA